MPFTIKVIDSDEINAFALPGGFFYVNSGLILNADEEAELAGVMAHETAHVCAHHAVREMTRMNYAQLGTIPLIFIGGWTGYGIYEAASIGIPITFMKFSREFESQADYLGVQYMYRAGYDPQAFITFFEKIQALEKRKPGAVAKVFADHPQTPDRILHTQEEIARILPARDEYMVTTSEFDEVKARLARIENKRRLTDTKGVTRPSLRRASTGTDSGNCTKPDRRWHEFRRQAHAASPRRPELSPDLSTAASNAKRTAQLTIPPACVNAPPRYTLVAEGTAFQSMKKIVIFAAVFVFILLLTKIANQMPPEPPPGTAFCPQSPAGHRVQRQRHHHGGQSPDRHAS